MLDWFEHLYNHSDPWDQDGPYQTARRAQILPHIKGTVLELGCGTGHLTKDMASAGHKVCALDFSHYGIARAQKLCGGLGVHWVICDVTSNFPTGTWDTAVISEILYYLSDQEIIALAGHVYKSCSRAVLCHHKEKISDEKYLCSGEHAHGVWWSVFNREIVASSTSTHILEVYE
jgi:SAM-dependent methyltransferase